MTQAFFTAAFILNLNVADDPHDWAPFLMVPFFWYSSLEEDNEMENQKIKKQKDASWMMEEGYQKDEKLDPRKYTDETSFGFFFLFRL